MAFKKIKSGEEEIFELRILDQNRIKVGEWIIMKSDFPKVVKILSRKYGFKIYVKDDRDRDLDWAL